MNFADHRPQHTTLRLTAKEVLWPLCLLALGFVFITLHQTSYFHAIPGDLGDPRFNNAVLEHLFRWVTGKDSSLWSPPYFYPYPGTLAFSDNHFGSGPVYVVMRLLGLGPEGAFIGWYSFAVPLNFVSCYYVLRRSDLSQRGSAIGAFIFTFAFNISAQYAHAQLAYRFAIPLAVLAAQRLLENRSPQQLAQIALWVTWQFYCSIYLGYFLTLLLIACAIMLTFMKPADGLTSPPRAVASALRNAWAGKAWGSTLVVALCLVALTVMFYPYMHYSHLYHVTRGYDEIQMMLPRPESYLLSDGSLLWGDMSRRIGDLPIRWEHQMFFGAATCALAAIGIRGTWDKASKVALGALLLLVVLTLKVHEHSLYILVAQLPLANAIRAVTRIGLVLILPVAFLAGRGVDWLVGSTRHHLAKTVTAFVLVALMMVEYAAYSTEMVPIKDLDQRLGKLLALVPAPLPADAILYLPPQPSDPVVLHSELDGMRLIAATDRPTLNGYSGSAPAGFEEPGIDACDTVNNRLTNYAVLAGANYEQYAQLVRRVVVLGGKTPCDPLPTLAKRTHFVGDVPKDVVAATELGVTRLRMVDGKLVATFQISNHSRGTLHAISDENHPLRFSWRISPVQATVAPNDGWNTRKALNADVGPAEQLSVQVIIETPTAPGIYRLEASVVQEYVIWFHQGGMPIARSAQDFEVRPDGTVAVLPVESRP